MIPQQTAVSSDEQHKMQTVTLVEEDETNVCDSIPILSCWQDVDERHYAIVENPFFPQENAQSLVFMPGFLHNLVLVWLLSKTVKLSQTCLQFAMTTHCKIS